MAWIAVTEQFVTTRLTGAELSALKASALAPGQSNPLPEIITGVVNEWRGRLRTYHTLADGDTIPDELLHHVLAMIRFRLITRLPGMKGLLDDARVNEWEKANEALNKVKEFTFVSPAVPDTDAAEGPGRAVFTEIDRDYSRDNQNGLP